MLATSDVLSVVLFILGNAWIIAKVRQRVGTQRTHKFWRGFARIDQSKVIVGMHPELASWDPAGLAGVGDIKALIELEAIFVESGLGRLPGTGGLGSSGRSHSQRSTHFWSN
jgi:hypothetical protein